MMRTLARRMASEQVWDQSAYSQEGLWPALGLKGRVGSRVSLRVLSYACYCNTKRDMAETWLRLGLDMAKTWLRYGRDMAALSHASGT